MILIDTSAWIDFFRGRGLDGDVDSALDTDEATLCGPVVTELRRGLTHTDREHVLGLLSGCRLLEPPDDLWQDAGDLGFALRERGVTAKTLDLLIATYALAYDIPVLTRDKRLRANE